MEQPGVVAENFALSFSLNFFLAVLCISKAPFSRSLWSGHHWKDLFLLQKLSIDDANRPLALRGHETNASLKQWVVILRLPKINRTHKNYLTPEVWEETHLKKMFYGTLIFQQRIMICIGRHVGRQKRWRAYSCSPTWWLKLLVAYILLNVW